MTSINDSGKTHSSTKTYKEQALRRMKVALMPSMHPVVRGDTLD